MQRIAMRPNQSRRGSRPHGSRNRSWGSLTAALTLGLLIATGCSSSETAQAPKAATEPVAAPTEIAEPVTVRDAVDDGAKMIDVRTPEEFAAGHLRGAVNIDLVAPDFAKRVAALDQNAAYVVYCASGNRAGTAIEIMYDQGLGDLTNGGGYKDLVANGLPTT